MNRLDEELAQAVSESEASAEDHDTVAHGVVHDKEPGRASRRGLGLLVGLLGISAAILAVVLTSEEAAVYSKGVDQLLADSDRLAERNVRVEGSLVQGSLRRRDTPCEYRFSMAKNGKTLPVRFAQCVVPDTFRDVPGMAVNVTVQGRLSKKGYFEADQIMAKCPSKYEERAAKGEHLPYPAPDEAPLIVDEAPKGQRQL